MIAWLLNSYLLLILLILLEFKYSWGAARDSNLIENSWFGGICGNTLGVHSTSDDVVALNSSINKISGFNIEQADQQLNERYPSRNTGELDFPPSLIIERLKNELVKVRLCVVYDASFEEEFSGQDDLENYVRNMIFAAQLIFNQRELAQHVKINLVVVILKKSTQIFPKDMMASEIFREFYNGSDIEPLSRIDLNILMTSRTLFDFSGKYSVKTLGQSGTDTFCNYVRYRTAPLIMTIQSLGSAVVLAHEIAHSFGVDHDGSNTSSECTDSLYIMYPSIGPGRLHWSKCSTNRILERFIFRANCIFNPHRIQTAIPLKPLFDLEPREGNENVKHLPGQHTPIDAQCAQALDKNAKSSLNTFGRNGRDIFDTCQSLVCSVGDYMQIAIGPAPAGSQCKQKNGFCLAGSCIVAKKGS